MEIGDNPDFRELRVFAQNILDHGHIDGPEHAKWMKEVHVRYLEAFSHVLVAEKLSKDLSSLTNQLSEAVRLASENSSRDAERALSVTRGLKRATWGLFVATAALVYATWILARSPV